MDVALPLLSEMILIFLLFVVVLPEENQKERKTIFYILSVQPVRTEKVQYPEGSLLVPECISVS